MSEKTAAMREAARNALHLRRTLSIPRDHSINVFDVATAIGVGVHFVDVRSLEGMFYRGPDPKIFLPSLRHRPRGRVCFSCAHELGHFCLGHGTRVDKYIEGDSKEQGGDIEELAADTFASSLLMPRPAILSRFECRGLKIAEATPIQLFQIASELGVGYSTLVRHLYYGLELVNNHWMTDRLRTTPKQIKKELITEPRASPVWPLTPHWPSVPLDLEVGDIVVLSHSLTIGKSSLLEPIDSGRDLSAYVASCPGVDRLPFSSHFIDIRIAQSGYCGLFRYRFIPQGND